MCIVFYLKCKSNYVKYNISDIVFILLYDFQYIIFFLLIGGKPDDITVLLAAVTNLLGEKSEPMPAVVAHHSLSDHGWNNFYFV